MAMALSLLAGFVAAITFASGQGDSEREKFAKSDCRMVRGMMNSVAARADEKYRTVEDKYAKMATPGKHHEYLKVFEGKWNTKATIYDISGKSKQAEAVSTIKWILGNRFLTEDLDEKTSDFRGMGIIGYDNDKKKYFMVWVDTMGTGQFTSEGTSDNAGKTFTLKGEAKELSEDGKITYTQTYRVESNDKILYEMHVKNDGNGKEYKAMEIVYTRAK